LLSGAMALHTYSTAEQPGLAPNVQFAMSAIDLAVWPQNESRPATSSEARLQEALPSSSCPETTRPQASFSLQYWLL